MHKRSDRVDDDSSLQNIVKKIRRIDDPSGALQYDGVDVIEDVDGVEGVEGLSPRTVRYRNRQTYMDNIYLDKNAPPFGAVARGYEGTLGSLPSPVTLESPDVVSPQERETRSPVAELPVELTSPAAVSGIFGRSSVTRLLTGVSAASVAFMALCLSDAPVDSRIRFAATLGVFASVSDVIADRIAEECTFGRQSFT